MADRTGAATWRCVLAACVLCAQGCAFAQTGVGDGSSPAKKPVEERDRYIEIPVIGEIGKDVVAKGMAEALAPAKKRGVGHVVLVFDCAGGNLADALATAGVMDTYARDFQFHALVKGKARDAGLWLLAGCADVWVVDGGGGVVVGYQEAAATASPEDDVRKASALAVELGGRAEHAKQSSLLYRAMVSREVEVYLTADEKGRPVVQGSRPDSGVGEVIDGSDTLLAMTAAQMVKVGMARPSASGEAASLGRTMGLENWKKSDSPSGVTLMKHAAKDLESMLVERTKRRERITRTQETIEAIPAELELLKKAAKDADPESLQLSYFQGSGQLTDESRRLWRERTDRAVEKWREVQRRLKELERAEKDFRAAVDGFNKQEQEIAKARRLTEPPAPLVLEPPRTGVNKDLEWRSAELEIERLNSRRDRGKI